LVSTLGLEVGLTVSAAGPVGAVVGALTGLGFLFGGGPDIPRELRLPAHSPEGLMRAGATDLVNQESEGAPPSNTLPRIQIPFLHRPGLGYNYCGAGSIPGNPTDPTDKCYKQHDDCYAKAGLSAQNVNRSHPGQGACKDQLKCDLDLCDCIGVIRSLGLYEHLVQVGIVQLFCH
jgi:hypothetical protein